MLISEFKNTFFSKHKYIAEHVANYTFYAHLHDLFEFIYIQSGECVVSLEGKKIRLTNSHAFMIPPWHLHGIDASAAESMYMFTFSSSCIPYCDLLRLSGLFLPYQPASDCLDFLLKHFFQEQCTDPFLLFSAVNYLMSDYTQRQKPLVSDLTVEKENDLVERALSYMKDHFTENLTLSKLSKNIGSNPSYLSRLLNAGQGLGFSGYLNAFRFSYAETQLRSTNMPIREIANACGFGSVRTFNRNFIATYKKTPMELRKQETEQQSNEFYSKAEQTDRENH